jgi:hypothetical protein
MGGKSGLPMNMVPAENIADDKLYYNVGERKLMESATENNRFNPISSSSDGDPNWNKVKIGA